ncbi:predicted protein [Naegleria gruberi]|uniref:Predicted protein n=1 Tax=Naegleria gruberi TaxID=5762 RepID=D2VVW1_NAEGR|nr:uncharacterized protein NAEGRDRAFT_73160 [Naegleria gruberi]EFC39173.1 predicted protein [Naegleria gruberi]|eukprot:XP_002671917.1 predicted protein [Naegleria gruberi strain NEG-M]
METTSTVVSSLSSGWFQLSIWNLLMVIVGLFALLLILHTISFLKTYIKFKDTPGYVSFLPAVLDALVKKRIYVHNQYECTLEAFKKNPNAKVVKVQMGGSCQILVARDQALIKEILVKKYKTISKGESLAPVGLFGPNMFSADSSNPLWKKHRTMANPIFSSSSHLKNVFRVTLEETKKMLNFWKSIYGSETDGSIRKVNVTNEFKSITLNVINRVAFDYDVGIFDNGAKYRDELHDWVTDLLTGLIYTFVMPKFLFEYAPFGIFKRFRDAKERFKVATLTMIDKKQKEMDSNEFIQKDDEDLLTLLLKSSAAASSEDEKLSRDELLSAIFIVFFAGFETSSASLNFMLRMLAKNQQFQDEVVREIDQEIKHADDISFELITNKLPLLTSFIKEVLRTKTPVGGGARVINSKKGDFINGVHYPQGTSVTISYFSQHYYAKEGHDDFDPYRFMDKKSTSTAAATSDEVGENETGETYGKGPMGELNIDFGSDGILPFSIGPRDCIGKRMALLEMKLILVFLLKNYRLKVPKGLEEAQDAVPETYIVTRTVFEPYLIDFETRQ